MNKTNKKNNKPSVMHRIHLFWHDETYHSTILVYYTNNSKIPTIVFTQCHAIYRISLYYVYAISRNLNYLSTIFFNKLLPDNTKQLFFFFLLQYHMSIYCMIMLAESVRIYANHIITEKKRCWNIHTFFRLLMTLDLTIYSYGIYSPDRMLLPI